MICTHGGAKLIDRPDYGLALNNTADLVILPAEPSQSRCRPPAARIVIKRGKIISTR